MHKIFIKYFVVIFVILCFTINGTNAKTYNTLLTNKDNSKLRLITYNDNLINKCSDSIKFSNNILFLNQLYMTKSDAIYLIKFENNHIKNAIAIQTKDIPQSDFGVNFKQPYIKDNNILIPFTLVDPVYTNHHAVYSSSYKTIYSWYNSKYIFLTSDQIKISNDLNKVDTPIAIYADRGYYFPFNQEQDRYLLYAPVLGNLFGWRDYFYLYKENKNTNTFQSQGVLMAAHGANVIENKDEVIIQFDKNDNVIIQNGKVKYKTFGAYLNHTYHSFLKRKVKFNDLTIDKADLISIPQYKMHIPDPSYNEDFYIFNFPPVIKKFTDKMGNKYYITDRYDKKVYFLLKINKNNTLDWIIRSELDIDKIITAVDEKNIKLKIEDGIYNVPYSKLPKSYWSTVKYTDTPLIINNSL